MPENEVKVPTPGSSLSFEDVEMISEAIVKRTENFPEEPLVMTVALVLSNIGDRFAPVQCINGEWAGIKAQIPRGTGGVPLCPNGHPMTQGDGLLLGWVTPS